LCDSGGVHEILRRLPPGAYVLDLGSRTGSFPRGGLNGTAVCVDAEIPADRPPLFVAARAEALPFRDRQFTAVISNHSLEHFDGLDESLHEIGRVMAPDGFLYIAVPDSSTITDRIYRLLARGGGHVNAFTSASKLAARVQQRTGLAHAGTRVLCTSLSFLNRANIQGPPQRLLLLFGNGAEPLLRVLTYGFRLVDRILRTRTCVYGWALYFGRGLEIETETWTNVCVRCGSAHASDWLRQKQLVSGRAYRCPRCGAKNYFTPDQAYGFLK